MKKTFVFCVTVFLLLLSTLCWAKGNKENKAYSSSDDAQISALGAIGQMEAAVSGPMYTGDGGKDIRLAVFAPEAQGSVPSYLPLYIQGLLNNNFKKYSAVTIIDRQNLDKIITEQNIGASGRFSDNDFISIGQLTNSRYYLFGTIQKLSGERYSLQLSVTDSTTGVRRANFMKDGLLSQIEGSGALINEATANLLEQMGVRLSETGKRTLLAGNISAVQAEAGLAKGITAQAGGAEVTALFNFAQAITFDPSQLEALSRLNTLSTTISEGTLSQRIVNDLQVRDRWVEAFKEAARFFNDHPPFEIIFDPNLIQIGETDYAKRTANLGMRIALDPSEAGFGALNALLEGLEKTGRRGAWGFSGWPLMDISPKTAGTVVFDGARSFSYKVDVTLLNENNKTLSNSSITLKTEAINFASGDTMVWSPDYVDGIVNFQNVKAEDLTPVLTIVIVAVNGIRSRDLSATGYMRIETGDLENIGVVQPLGHSETVCSVAFSPDGKQIISGSGDNTVKLWDTATGREIRTFSGHSDYVTSVAFSPDGKQIISGSEDNNVKLWDTATGREIRTFSGLSDYVFSNEEISVAFSPDGKHIIFISEDNTVKLCDTVTGREIRTFSGHSHNVTSVAFNHDGKQIISVDVYGIIKLWDIDTGREIRTFSGNDPELSLSVAFSPDGKQILSSSEKTFKLFEIVTGREIRRFSGNGGAIITFLAFSPDGKQIISIGNSGIIKLWNAATGREVKTFYRWLFSHSTVAFSPDGNKILFGDRNQIKVLNITTGRTILTIGTDNFGQ